MSCIRRHIADSFSHIEKEHPDIYRYRKDILDKLIPELHSWFDEFDGKKTNEYDYTGVNCVKHREQRHHIQGISEALRKFSEKYGPEFKMIIRDEAERHLLNDMGVIYFEEDYHRIGFWKDIRGW